MEINKRDLCLFPSSLFHYTIPFEPEEERISFAFDVMPTQYGGVRTSKIMKLLQELDLFTPWEIKFLNHEEVTTAVQGIYKINEEKLKQLNDEDWLSLKNGEALPVIYGQLISTGNAQTLASNLQSKIDYAKDLDVFQESIGFQWTEITKRLTLMICNA